MTWNVQNWKYNYTNLNSKMFPTTEQHPTRHQLNLHNCIIKVVMLCIRPDNMLKRNVKFLNNQECTKNCQAQPGIILCMCPANQRQCYIFISYWLSAYKKNPCSTCLHGDMFPDITNHPTILNRNNFVVICFMTIIIIPLKISGKYEIFNEYQWQHRDSVWIKGGRLNGDNAHLCCWRWG